jgi:hypothetical protein
MKFGITVYLFCKLIYNEIWETMIEPTPSHKLSWIELKSNMKGPNWIKPISSWTNEMNEYCIYI